MSIKKTKNGYLVDIQPGGRGGKRIRKKFKTKIEATQFINWINGKQIDPEWKPKKKDTRKLLELITLWKDIHGQSLKDCENRYRWLNQIALEIGNPAAFQITPTLFTSWRSARLADGNSISTVNNALAYLRAVFAELIRADLWKEENPFSKIRQLKKQDTELSYLSEDQIIDLLTAADEGKNKSTRLVIEICLSTGARWTEAESLKRSQIGSHKITFSATKNSKNRSLPIPDCLHRKLSAIKNDHLFTPCYSAFREAIERAGITLPKGQLSHVLRHTFASSFMMNKGDILVLQRALGHNNLTMTMRYAHFAPEHMSQVSTLNPLC